MSADQLTELQHRLLDARIARHCLDATEFESAEMDKAYEIQSQLIQQYCHETASKISGWKVALSGHPLRPNMACNSLSMDNFVPICN